jgi:hypothetical protein
MAVDDCRFRLSLMKTQHQVSPQTPSREGEGREPRLGVDIGRVIIAGDGPDTSFVGGTDEEALRAPEVDGAVAAIARLVPQFGRRVWLVSKCGPRVQARTRLWLARQRFFERTGVPENNLLFCRTRPEKAPICLKLGITCFVDDRVDVLVSMAGIVPLRLLFGARTSPEAGVLPVAGWRQAESALAAASASRMPGVANAANPATETR